MRTTAGVGSASDRRTGVLFSKATWIKDNAPQRDSKFDVESIRTFISPRCVFVFCFLFSLSRLSNESERKRMEAGRVPTSGANTHVWLVFILSLKNGHETKNYKVPLFKRSIQMFRPFLLELKWPTNGVSIKISFFEYNTLPPPKKKKET